MNYLDQYAAFLKGALRPARQLKVVFDSSNGTTGPIIEKIFSGTSVAFELINGKPDGAFPAHGPDPMKPGALDMAKAKTLEIRADCGFVFDADGDRVFAVDNTGRILAADDAALLIAKETRGAAVLDGSMGMKIRDALKSGNRAIHDSKTGHVFVKELMRKYDCGFGAEGSGHFYFKDFYHADSGIFAAIVIINAVSKLDKPLSEFLNSLPPCFRRSEENFRILNKSAAVKRIDEAFAVRAAAASRKDGLRFEFNAPARMWFSVRPSNTEDVLRLNIESENEELLEKTRAEIISLIGKDITS